MSVEIKKLYTAKSKYDSAIGNLESKLRSKVEFEFWILYQPSDGFVILDNDANNAPLHACLSIIEKTGTLSRDNYLDSII